MGSESKKNEIKFLKNLIYIFVALLLLVLVATEFLYYQNIIALSPSKYLLDLFDASATDTQSEEVLFLNVGQGDSTIIKSKNAVAVIDFGPEDEKDTVYRNLLDIGAQRVDLAVITHNHLDHLGGFLNLAKKFKIDRLLISVESAEDADIEKLNKVLSFCKENDIKIYNPQVGGVFKIGDASLKILYADKTADEENNRSIITMLNIGGSKILFMGDAERKQENIISRTCDIDCNILKMGHHGSYTSTNQNLLKASTPKVAIASAGYDNLYSHPSIWAVKRVEEMNIKLYRTDLDRTIRCTFIKENKIFKISSERTNKV